jgi:hypothetical protein
MAIDTDKGSASDSLRKARSFGKVRCHNPSCMKRMKPAYGDDRVQCSICGMEYRIYWLGPDLPRIRGPVWETNRKLAAEKLNANGQE